jgi:hypothetical protein
MELQPYIRVPINYEDALYQYGPEIADVTNAVSRPAVAAAHPGFKVLVPQGGSLSFSFKKLIGASETAADPDSAVAAVVAAYNSSGMGGEYQISKANGQYYVVPAFRKDLSGARVPTSSVLMQPVSLPADTKTPAEFLEAILTQVRASCSCKIGIATVPLQGFLGMHTTLAAAAEPARDVLARLFQAIAERKYSDGTAVTALAYRLLFDPGDQAYMLNIRVAIAPAVVPVNVTGKPLPVSGSNSGNPWFRVKP